MCCLTPWKKCWRVLFFLYQKEQIWSLKKWIDLSLLLYCVSRHILTEPLQIFVVNFHSRRFWADFSFDVLYDVTLWVVFSEVWRSVFLTLLYESCLSPTLPTLHHWPETFLCCWARRLWQTSSWGTLPPLRASNIWKQKQTKVYIVSTRPIGKTLVSFLASNIWKQINQMLHVNVSIISIGNRHPKMLHVKVKPCLLETDRSNATCQSQHHS